MLLSHSPTTYKIPNISDLPQDFRLELLDNPDNVVSIKRSKAVGEPPLLLGLSVWCAVKDALASAAKVAGSKEQVPMSLPATNEEILLRLTAISASRQGSIALSLG
jgi:xanthine dehydrogenase large subunit